MGPDFYGPLLGWSELDSLRLPDRLTLAVGAGTYVNTRERDVPMTCSGYEHFGVVLETAEEVEAQWAELAARDEDLELGDLQRGDDGFRSMKFRHLLPMAVEVQHFPV